MGHQKQVRRARAPPVCGGLFPGATQELQVPVRVVSDFPSPGLGHAVIPVGVPEPEDSGTCSGLDQHSSMC